MDPSFCNNPYCLGAQGEMLTCGIEDLVILAPHFLKNWSQRTLPMVFLSYSF